MIGWFLDFINIDSMSSSKFDCFDHIYQCYNRLLDIRSLVVLSIELLNNPIIISNRSDQRLSKDTYSRLGALNERLNLIER